MSPNKTGSRSQRLFVRRHCQEHLFWQETEAENGDLEEQLKWNAEETGTRLLFVCKRNIPIQVARLKARATQAPSTWKKNVNLKSTWKMVDETLGLEVPTVKKIVVKKTLRQGLSFADKSRA